MRLKVESAERVANVERVEQRNQRHADRANNSISKPYHMMILSACFKVLDIFQKNSFPF